MKKTKRIQSDDTLYDRAVTYAKQGHEIYNKCESEINPEAEALYRLSLECLSSIKEKSYRTYFLLGTTAEWLRQYDDALRYLDRSLDDPKNDEYRQQALYWKAVALWEGFERKAEALPLFWQCFGKETDTAWKFNILDWIMRIYVSEPADHEGIKRWADTIRKLMPVSHNPDLPFLVYVLQLKKNGGRLDELLALIDLGLMCLPSDARLLLEKAECLTRMGRKKEGKTVLEKVEAQSEKLPPYAMSKIERIRKEL